MRRTRLLAAASLSAALSLATAAGAGAESTTQDVTASVASTLTADYSGLTKPVALGSLSTASSTVWTAAGNIKVSADALSSYTVKVKGAPLTSTDQSHSLAALNASLNGGGLGTPIGTSDTTLVGLNGLTTAVVGGTATYNVHLNQVVTLADKPATDYTTTLTYTVSSGV